MRWPNVAYDTDDIAIGDFCTRLGTAQKYLVSAVPAPNNPKMVQITPIKPYVDPTVTSESVRPSELGYLPPVSPVEVKLKDQINKAVSSAVQGHLMNHTVFMSHQKELMGTGTLVQSQGVYGILTASHCLHDPLLTEPVIFGKPDTKFLHLSVDQRLKSAFSIHCEVLREIPIARPKDGQYIWYGPDVTFIRIPESIAGDIAARKSFVDIDVQIINHSAPPPDSTVFSVGFPVQNIEPEQNLKGVVTGIKLQLMIMNAGVLSSLDASELDDYDYIEFPTQIDQPDRDDIPRDFRGISGGGVWCFRLVLNTNDDEPVVSASLALLAGVNYRVDALFFDKDGVLSTTIRSHFYDVLKHLQAKIKADNKNSFNSFVVAPASPE